MTSEEMQGFIGDIVATWPHIAEQWQSGVYATRLRTDLVRIDLETANRGLFRWVEEHNRPPTVMNLLDAIDHVQDEQRQREARAPVEFPRAKDIPEEDRDVAREALAAMHALVDKKLEMIPTGGYRRSPEELQAHIQAKGLTNYAGKGT